MKLDLPTLEMLQVHGISFVVSLNAPWGGDTVGLSAKDVTAFVNDKVQFAADYHKVSKTEYLEWVDTRGTPRCGGRTKTGARCKNAVSGGSQRPIQEWLTLDGQLCAVHGGDNSI